jgi:hypothetical protein
VALVRTDVMEECIASIIFLHGVFQLLVTASVLSMPSSETSVLTTATSNHLPEDGILEALKSMLFQISEQLEIRKGEADVEYARSCPNTLHLFPESVRRPLRNLVDGVCPRRPVLRRLHASEFQVCTVGISLNCLIYITAGGNVLHCPSELSGRCTVK